MSFLASSKIALILVWITGLFLIVALLSFDLFFWGREIVSGDESCQGLDPGLPIGKCADIVYVGFDWLKFTIGLAPVFLIVIGLVHYTRHRRKKRSIKNYSNLE